MRIRSSVVYDLLAANPFAMKLSQIASALNARLENSFVDTEITGLNGIENAGPGELTFVANPKYAAAARLTKAAAVIVAENFPVIPAATLRVEDPYLSFAGALELFHEPLRSFIHQRRLDEMPISALMWSSTRMSRSAPAPYSWRML
jgi:UDP-3-O-[3-hydroxymyristoyl] glucosamine N-acyltransferase